MPRVVRDSDEEVEPRTTRRTRASVAAAATDSPVRRTIRSIRQLITVESSPESMDDSSSQCTIRLTRSRVATLEKVAVKNLRSRKNSAASDASEAMDGDAEGSQKRLTRRNALAQSAVGTPTKTNLRTRAIRAGSEAKSTPPTKIKRATRASSVEPVSLNESTEIPNKRRTRASVVPTEPTVTEEEDKKSEAYKSLENTVDEEIEEDDTGSVKKEKVIKKSSKSVSQSQDTNVKELDHDSEKSTLETYNKLTDEASIIKTSNTITLSDNILESSVFQLKTDTNLQGLNKVEVTNLTSVNNQTNLHSHSSYTKILKDKNYENEHIDVETLTESTLTDESLTQVNSPESSIIDKTIENSKLDIKDVYVKLNRTSLVEKILNEKLEDEKNSNENQLNSTVGQNNVILEHKTAIVLVNDFVKAHENLSVNFGNVRHRTPSLEQSPISNEDAEIISNNESKVNSIVTCGSNEKLNLKPIENVKVKLKSESNNNNNNNNTINNSTTSDTVTDSNNLNKIDGKSENSGIQKDNIIKHKLENSKKVENMSADEPENRDSAENELGNLNKVENISVDETENMDFVENKFKNSEVENMSVNEMENIVSVIESKDEQEISIIKHENEIKIIEIEPNSDLKSVVENEKSVNLTPKIYLKSDVKIKEINGSLNSNAENKNVESENLLSTTENKKKKDKETEIDTGNETENDTESDYAMVLGFSDDETLDSTNKSNCEIIDEIVDQSAIENSNESVTLNVVDESTVISKVDESTDVSIPSESVTVNAVDESVVVSTVDEFINAVNQSAAVNRVDESAATNAVDESVAQSQANENLNSVNIGNDKLKNISSNNENLKKVEYSAPSVLTNETSSTFVNSSSNEQKDPIVDNLDKVKCSLVLSEPNKSPMHANEMFDSVNEYESEAKDPALDNVKPKDSLTPKVPHENESSNQTVPIVNNEPKSTGIVTNEQSIEVDDTSIDVPTSQPTSDLASIEALSESQLGDEVAPLVDGDACAYTVSGTDKNSVSSAVTDADGESASSSPEKVTASRRKRGKPENETDDDADDANFQDIAAEEWSGDKPTVAKKNASIIEESLSQRTRKSLESKNEAESKEFAENNESNDTLVGNGTEANESESESEHAENKSPNRSHRSLNKRSKTNQSESDQSKDESVIEIIPTSVSEDKSVNEGHKSLENQLVLEEKRSENGSLSTTLSDSKTIKRQSDVSNKSVMEIQMADEPMEVDEESDEQFETEKVEDKLNKSRKLLDNSALNQSANKNEKLAASLNNLKSRKSLSTSPHNSVVEEQLESNNTTSDEEVEFVDQIQEEEEEEEDDQEKPANKSPSQSQATTDEFNEINKSSSEQIRRITEKLAASLNTSKKSLKSRLSDKVQSLADEEDQDTDSVSEDENDEKSGEKFITVLEKAPAHKQLGAREVVVSRLENETFKNKDKTLKEFSSRKSLSKSVNSSVVAEDSSDAEVEIKESKNKSLRETSLRKSLNKSVNASKNIIEDSSGTEKDGKESKNKSLNETSSKKSLAKSVNASIIDPDDSSEIETEDVDNEKAPNEVKNKSLNVDRKSLKLANTSLKSSTKTSAKDTNTSPRTDFSTIATVDSESNHDQDEEDEAVPTFESQASDFSSDATVDSSEDESDDKQKSMDSDIAKEYNLAGDDDCKYEDDDIPGDECRASEEEETESEDDGEDLNDFIVSDFNGKEEEDSKSESEGDEEHEEGEDEEDDDQLEVEVAEPKPKNVNLSKSEINKNVNNFKGSVKNKLLSDSKSANNLSKSQYFQSSGSESDDEATATEVEGKSANKKNANSSNFLKNKSLNNSKSVKETSMNLSKSLKEKSFNNPKSIKNKSIVTVNSDSDDEGIVQEVVSKNNSVDMSRLQEKLLNASESAKDKSMNQSKPVLQKSITDVSKSKSKSIIASYQLNSSISESEDDANVTKETQAKSRRSEGNEIESPSSESESEEGEDSYRVVMVVPPVQNSKPASKKISRLIECSTPKSGVSKKFEFSKDHNLAIASNKTVASRRKSSSLNDLTNAHISNITSIANATISKLKGDDETEAALYHRQPWKLIPLNQTVFPKGGDTPVTKYLKKQKLNDSVPILESMKSGDLDEIKSSETRRSLQEKGFDKHLQFQVDDANQAESLNEIRKPNKRRSLQKSVKEVEDIVSVADVKKSKKRKLQDMSNMDSLDIEDESMMKVLKKGKKRARFEESEINEADNVENEELPAQENQTKRKKKGKQIISEMNVEERNKQGKKKNKNSLVFEQVSRISLSPQEKSKKNKMKIEEISNESQLNEEEKSKKKNKTKEVKIDGMSVPLIANEQKSKKKKKALVAQEEVEEQVPEISESLEEKPKKKKKKSLEVEQQVEERVIEISESLEEKPKKKKKKSLEVQQEVEERITEISESLEEKPKKKKKKSSETQQMVEELVSEISQASEEKPKKKKTKSLEVQEPTEEEPIIEDVIKISKKKSRSSTEKSDRDSDPLKVKKKKSKHSLENEVDPEKKSKRKSKEAALEEDDDAPESVGFAEARLSALAHIQQAAESAKAQRQLRKQRKEDHIERMHKNREVLCEKRSLKRLSEDVLEELADETAIRRPVKRQKLSRTTERNMPSTSMFSPGKQAPANLRVDDGYVPLSSAGGTTEFGVVNLQKAKKVTKKSVAALNFREKMLARNFRQPISSYLMYLKKQKSK